MEARSPPMLRNLRSALREWWQWRARQGRSHVWGVSEYRSVGTVTSRDENQWVILEDDGRRVYVPHPQAVGIDIGDRVEVAPSIQGPVIRPDAWIVLRNLSRDAREQ